MRASNPLKITLVQIPPFLNLSNYELLFLNNTQIIRGEIRDFWIASLYNLTTHINSSNSLILLNSADLALQWIILSDIDRFHFIINVVRNLGRRVGYQILFLGLEALSRTRLHHTMKIFDLTHQTTSIYFARVLTCGQT